MARMYTRKRGKSGSKRNFARDDHSWVTMTDEETKQAIISLKNEGLSNSMVGMRLRDQYGNPGSKVMLGKKLATVLAENGIRDDIPEDLKALIEKYKSVSKHIELDKRDPAAIRNRNLIMSKALRLVRYYKLNNYLSKEWSLSKVL